ncbi:MAG TPA: isoprenoid biosynthesis glyoxalase ElbB [Candidatus Marinimicrobia bacterium]|nr:isoprenoid biosynthesis glyoxalase ElbB [Candidatus Neomarinimicrobiota bacterium]
MKKAAVVLAGCGVYDGAEIHEAVLTMLALDQRDVEMTIFAPDIEQMHVVNHLDGSEMAEKRNVLVEAARIARGNIKDLAQGKGEDFDAIFFPGGFGVAKNLCNLAVKGADCEIDPEVLRFIQEGLKNRKALGFACIAPAMLAKAAASINISLNLTIGNDKNTAATIEVMGSKHYNCPTESCIVDIENRVVTTPAYMTGQRISEVWTGIQKMVLEVLKLI